MLLKDFCKACSSAVIDLTVCGETIEFHSSSFDDTNFSSLTAYPEKLVVVKFSLLIEVPGVIGVLAR
ncbi:MAG: hypothetical protein PHT03_08065 [Bacilli bacterium]|nr:hypothetical protein [Bacilli bacterium]